jgi:hypothetical protein
LKPPDARRARGGDSALLSWRAPHGRARLRWR